MNCTKCNQPINERKGYFKTNKGFHHFICGVENLRDTSRLPSDTIEKLIEMYENRGPAVTKFEAMSGVIAALESQLAEANAGIEATRWRPITPEDLPKVGDEIISNRGEVENVNDNDTDIAFRTWIMAGWTHFRPIAPPERKEQP